jgi:hypothetical protein
MTDLQIIAVGVLAGVIVGVFLSFALLAAMHNREVAQRSK